VERLPYPSLGFLTGSFGTKKEFLSGPAVSIDKFGYATWNESAAPSFSSLDKETLAQLDAALVHGNQDDFYPDDYEPPIGRAAPVARPAQLCRVAGGDVVPALDAPHSVRFVTPACLDVAPIVTQDEVDVSAVRALETLSLHSPVKNVRVEDPIQVEGYDDAPNVRSLEWSARLAVGITGPCLCNGPMPSSVMWLPGAAGLGLTYGNTSHACLRWNVVDGTGPLKLFLDKVLKRASYVPPHIIDVVKEGLIAIAAADLYSDWNATPRMWPVQVLIKGGAFHPGGAAAAEFLRTVMEHAEDCMGPPTDAQFWNSYFSVYPARMFCSRVLAGFPHWPDGELRHCPLRDPLAYQEPLSAPYLATAHRSIPAYADMALVLPDIGAVAGVVSVIIARGGFVRFRPDYHVPVVNVSSIRPCVSDLGDARLSVQPGRAYHVMVADDLIRSPSCQLILYDGGRAVPTDGLFISLQGHHLLGVRSVVGGKLGPTWELAKRDALTLGSFLRCKIVTNELSRLNRWQIHAQCKLFELLVAAYDFMLGEARGNLLVPLSVATVDDGVMSLLCQLPQRNVYHVALFGKSQLLSRCLKPYDSVPNPRRLLFSGGGYIGLLSGGLETSGANTVVNAAYLRPQKVPRGRVFRR